MRAAVVVAALLAASAAWAHPLGNFTTNRQARVVLGPGTLHVRYVIDMAELPTYRTLAEIDANGDGTADPDEYRAWAGTLAREVGRRLHVTIDDREMMLRPAAQHAESLPGAAGLPTLRAELEFDAPLAAARGSVAVRDDNFVGLPGWQEIIAAANPGTAVSTATAATVDRTDGLRRYPEDTLAAPPQMREVRFTYEPGSASARAPARASAVRGGAERFGDRLTAVIADRRPLSASLVLGALVVAAMLGAFHALTPGHGKTIVGAYLVGSHGTWKHAVFLGLVVTATHTLGVYVLGAATLVASAWVLPERLLPWLGAASGLLVVAVGASLLRQRLEVALHGHAHHHGDPHDHHHHHDHHHGDPDRRHSHVPPSEMAPTLRNLVALGVSGGMLPCPSALVVMLGAIALGRTAFGLVLILAFSAGLAAVLTAIGLALVYARGLFERLPIDGRVARFAPVASAAIISLAGVGIVAEALARIGA